MIILDTNVVAGLMRLHFEPALRVWLDRQDQERLFSSTLTVFEISFGIEKMSKGRRRRALETAFDEVIVKALGHRIVGFDTAAANAAARARASQIRQGINAEIPDSQIAGIALSLGAAVATRNTADFAGLGLQIVNPWASGT